MRSGSTHWSATENRVVQPYKRADDALHLVRFRVSPESVFSSERRLWFNRENVPKSFVPEFEFDIDAQAVADTVGIPLGDLRACVVVRDRAVKRWILADSWQLEALPSTATVNLIGQDFANGRRMEFVLMVTPSSDLPVQEGRAHKRNQVVAEVAFEANIRNDGSRFSVVTMPPDWFEQHGLPKDAVWAIDWESHDPMVEPIAALNVVVNERYAELLQTVFGSDSGADALATEIAVDVFLEASLVVLKNAEEFQREPSTLLGSVLSGLGIDDESEFRAIREKVMDDYGRVTAYSLIRARAQSRIGLARAIGRAQNGQKT